MFDLRYHVASLAAVFLALVIGILVGVGISSGGFVQKGERRILNDKIDELERNLRLQDAVLKFQTVRLEDVKSGAAPAAGEIEFEHLDVLEDAEPEDSVARALGLEGNLRDDFRSMDIADADEPEEAGEDAEATP